jgi:hypothetical protein
VKSLLLLFLSLTLTVQSAYAGIADTYLAKTGNELAVGRAQDQLRDEIFALKGSAYEAAVLELGDAWKKNPEQIDPVIAKLQSLWERKYLSPVQANENKTSAQLLEQSEWLVLAGFLANEVLPRTLPYLAAVYGALQLSSSQVNAGSQTPRGPYEILANLAAPKAELEAKAAQAFTNAEAKLAGTIVGVAANRLITTGKAAAGFSLASFNVANLIKMAAVLTEQAVVFAVAGLAVSAFSRSILNAYTEGELKANLNKHRFALNRVLVNNMSGAAEFSRDYELAINQLGLFYSALSQDTWALRNTFEGECQTKIDQRLFYQALLHNDDVTSWELAGSDTLTAAEIVRSSNRTGTWEFHRQMALLYNERTGRVGFQSKTDQANFESAFLGSVAENRHFLEQAQADLIGSWGDCSDEIYLLFNSVEDVNTLLSTPNLSQEARDTLIATRDRLNQQFKFEYMKRKSLIAAMNLAHR